MVTFPCKSCTERHSGCHANCEKYLECKKKQQAEAKALNDWKKRAHCNQKRQLDR